MLDLLINNIMESVVVAMLLVCSSSNNIGKGFYRNLK